MGIPPHGFIRERGKDGYTSSRIYKRNGKMGIPPHGFIREMGKMGDNLRDSAPTNK